MNGMMEYWNNGKIGNMGNMGNNGIMEYWNIGMMSPLRKAKK